MGNSLTESYETLVRRGMPRRKGLALYDGPGAGLAYVFALAGAPLLNDDARDLLTMDALRWWVEVAQHSPPKGQLYERWAGSQMPMFVVSAPFSEWLQELISITTHMEPKHG